jgi:tetratricopeptide (TPR) repeat protein
MKPIIAACLIAMMLPALCFAADDVGALLDKALDQLVRNGYVGDTSAAERYLQAILEQQPDHLEAQWQLLYIQLVPLKNAPLPERATALAAFSPEFARLAKVAKQSKQPAFLHFMTAVHAGFYNAYERALSEIDRALALEPRSVRYLTARGRLQVEYGKWIESDAEVGKGIGVLKKARELLRTQPSPFVRDEHFDFYLAGAIADLSQPRWQEVAEHYQRFIGSSQKSAIYAFAWSNVSMAYRKLEECDKAREAAEKALAVMEFGAAQWNKRYAEFCLEMQKTEPGVKR